MQDSGGLRVYKRRLPAAAHPEIPLPWVGGEVALAERGPEEDGSWTLPGVVSRKKQFIPALMSAYQEL